MLNAFRRSMLSSVATPVLVMAGALAVSAPALAQVQIGSAFNSQGPTPNTPRTFSATDPNIPPDTGAVGVIVADPVTAGTIYVGAVNGGIWKTTNGGTSWTPLTDSLASLSILSMSL